MKKSAVYLVRQKETGIQARYSALLKLLHKIERDLPYKKNEFIPIKFTVGDSKCIYHVNPELIKPIVSLVKRKGARPFLFDTNVIYSGQRQNSIDHLNLVQNKGFGASRIGCPYLIADGLFGQDGKEHEIDSNYIKQVKIPSFIAMLDNLLVLSHVTGHILTGYAGALKNIAMGMVSRSTKLTQHSSIKPHIIKDKCTACACCIEACPANAISIKFKKAVIDPEKCIGCGECVCACIFDSIFIHWEDDDELFARRMIDVTQFILSKFKHKFFINFAFDITKECDCISTKTDTTIATNIGILASDDALSVDKATLDLIDKSSLSFRSVRPQGISTKMFKYAKEIKLGNIKYNLITL